MSASAETIQPVPPNRVARRSMLLAGIIVCIVVTILIGWQFNIEPLKHLNPYWVSMNPTTAACFLLAAAALFLNAISRSKSVLIASRVLSGIVITVAALKLLACVGGPDLRVDQFLYASQLPTSGVLLADGHTLPSRIAPNTAILFFLSSCALLLISCRRAACFPAARLLALVCAFLAILGAIGYFNGVTVLYRPTALIPMAIHTIVCFFLLSAGVLTLPPLVPLLPALSPAHAAIERRIKLGFGAALFLLAVIGAVAYASVETFAADAQLVQHARHMLTSISEVSNDLSDVEAGERGFVITGSDPFLDSYRRGLNVVDLHLQELRDLARDNPAQLARLDQLAPIVADELAFLDRVIKTRLAEGADAAHALVASGQGQRFIDAHQQILNDMRHAENILQDERARQSASSEETTLAVLTLGSLVAFILVGGAAWIVRREFAARYRLDRELVAARAAADEANAAKSRFLANMSHEIRTPMSVILGYADLVLDPTQTPSDRLDHINIIRRNGDHLLTLINDILDLSKIEAGKIRVESVECSPCKVLADIASLMRVRAAEKNITLDIRNDGAIPATILTDPHRLRQILINLVSNAIKFTEQGWVRVSMRLEESPDAPPALRFEVVDTGIGMTADQLSLLFKPFVQADDSTTRRFGGTGLGLTISKRLAELLGGSILVDSKPDRGSSFSFTVATGPLQGIKRLANCREALAGTEQPHETPMPVSAHGSILLVDDGEENRRLISVYLRQVGLQVALAENGKIAVEKALAALAENKPYDVILMDMQMPELDGYGAAAKLRTKGYTKPIIALTAHAMAEDRDRCINAGCTDYLSKPVRRPDLLATVYRYLPHDKTAPEPLIPAQSSALGGGSPQSSVLPGRIRPDLDDESLRPHLEAYLAELPSRVAELRSCFNTGNLDQLETRAHNLKGTGGLYGLMPITTAAANLEKCLLQKAAMPVVQYALDELIETIQSVEGVSANSQTSTVYQPSAIQRPV